MNKIETVIFDLDNVLFDESTYIFYAYYSIAVFLSKKSCFSEQQIHNRLVEYFGQKTSMYPKLFNDIVSEFGFEQTIVPEILDIYSSVDAPIELFSDVENFILELRKCGLKTALVTNGNVKTQRNKIRLLRIEKKFDLILCARENKYGLEKPDKGVYLEVLEKLGSEAKSTLCIGDNPYVDFFGAKKLGMITVRVLRGEFKSIRLSSDYEADYEVDSLTEILELIK